MSRFKSIFRATFKLIWLFLSFPYSVYKAFRNNRRYDKYYRERYSFGKRHFNDSSERLIKVYDDFVKLEKFYKHGT